MWLQLAAKALERLTKAQVFWWRADGHWSTVFGMSTPAFCISVSLTPPTEHQVTFYVGVRGPAAPAAATSPAP
jgi:hypothetical protein